MKRSLLAATALVSFTVALNAQTIPNGNFESWKTTILDLPNNWFSSSDDNPSIQTCTKTSDSRSGSAVKLESKDDGNGGVAFGFFANTKGDPTVGEGGAPYTQQPTSINGYYKGTFVTGDSAILLVIFKKNGVAFSQNTFKIGQSKSTYTAFSYPLTVSMAPDSVIVACASSDVIDNPNPPSGNIVFMDDISFGGAGITQQLSNSNFDSWTSKTFSGLISWSAYNSETTKTTDHYKGDAAVVIPVVDYGSGNIYGSALSLGEGDPFNQPGIPYGKSNDTLVFYYKFNSVGGDSAYVMANLTQNGNFVGSGYAILEPQATYTRFTLPLNAMQTPDTLRISFGCGTGQEHPASIGSELKVDEVTLLSEPLNTGLLNWTKTATDAKIYPNPMSTELNIWAGGYKNVQYRIVDITGKELLNGTANGNPINVSELHSGIYFVSIIFNGQILATQKVIKN